MGILTNAGRALFANKHQKKQALIIDRFVLAYIDGRDDLSENNPDEVLPPTSAIKLVEKVTKSAYINNDQVIYSLYLGTREGDFTFNWVGLLADDNTLVAFDNLPPIKKYASQQGKVGNSLTRNFLISYVDAKAITNVTVSADTWQWKFDQANESIAGIAKIATQAEVNAGVNDEKIITPKTLSNGEITFKQGISTGGKDVFLGGGAIVSSGGGEHFSGLRAGVNVDHIWHNDHTNTWNFCSDAAYQATGNSVLQASKYMAGIYEVWHAGNDGKGSGLDADKFQGLSPENFLRSDESTTLRVDDTKANQSKNGLLIDFNSSGSDALTQNRLHTAFRIDADFAATGGTTDNGHEHHASGLVVDLDATGDSDAVQGIYTHTYSKLTQGETTYLRGIRSVSWADNETGKINATSGGVFEAYAGKSGEKDALYATFNKAIMRSDSGDVTYAHGSYNEIETYGGKLTAALGVKSNIDIKGGEIDRGYLFYGAYDSETLPRTAYGVYIASPVKNFFRGSLEIGDVQYGPGITLSTEKNTTAIGDTFSGNTNKSYIHFKQGPNSNDPGFIMHETSSAETNEGVLHLCPSDDNGTGDYISIHGTNDQDALRLHTDGVIETSTHYDLQFKSKEGRGDVLINGQKAWHAGNDGKGSGLDADKLQGLSPEKFVRTDKNSTLTFNDTLANAHYTGLFIDYNASGADKLTADRAHAALRIDADFSASGGDTNHEHRGYGLIVDVDASATGDSDLLFGIEANATSTISAGQTSEVRGIYGLGIAKNTGGFVLTTCGGMFYAAASGQGEKHNLFGTYSRSLIESSSETVNYAYGAYCEVEIDGSRAENAYGVRSVIDTDGGSIGNGYLFHGEYQGALPENAHGIYIPSVVNNYLGGSLKIDDYLEVRNSISTSGGSLHLGGGSLVASGSVKQGTNIDHIWFDDTNPQNTWHFCADANHKTTGNAVLQAGSVQLGDTNDGPAMTLRSGRIETAATHTLELKSKRGRGDVLINGHKAWHAGNDGKDSGLDADKLQGLLPEKFVRTDKNSTLTFNDTVANASYTGLYLNYNASGADKLTADRAHAALRINADFSASGGDTNHEHRGYGLIVDVDANASGDSDLLFGIEASATSTISAGQTSEVRGIYALGIAKNTGGTINHIYGGLFYALSYNQGEKHNLFGTYSKSLIDATSETINEAYGAYCEVEVDGSRVKSAFGVRSVIDTDGGTIGSGYLFHGEYQGKLPEKAHGIYIPSAVNNYLGGALEVKGNVKTGGALEVKGNVKTDGTLEVKGGIKTDGTLEVKGGIKTHGTPLYLSSGSIIASLVGALDTSVNVDHIWYDDSNPNPNADGTRTLGTWHFCTDTAHRSTGNATLQAASIQLGDTATGPAISLRTVKNTEKIGDNFSGNTNKSYIHFKQGPNSNDPGFIMHETSSSETDEGVIHLCPSDNRSGSDYVSIHGTDEPDSLRLYTDGTIGTVGNHTLNLKSGKDDVKIDGHKAWHSGNSPVSKRESGYQKLPNGLIIQWGRVEFDSIPTGDHAHPGAPNHIHQRATGDFNLPIAFPSQAVAVMATGLGREYWEGDEFSIGIRSFTQRNVQYNAYRVGGSNFEGKEKAYFTYIAIGY